MIALKYTIITEQPLLITSLQGDPNSSVSFDYIPGSVIRGALIGLYQQQKPDIDDLLEDKVAKRLFFSPQTRFLNGYCAIGGERCLPLPKSLRSKKRAKPSDGLWDSSTAKYQLDRSEHRSFKGRFGRFNSNHELQIAESVATVLNIHTARDRQKGRATSSSGAVFRYEAIAPGQCFIGYILCESNEDVAKIQKLLTQQFLWLGGSRSAGYGKVRIEFEPVLDWTEYSTTELDRSANTITLLSDMLIRDQYGQYTTDLAGKLGLTPVPKYSNITSTIIGGFNRKWGLPLPQVPAIAMGSVFVVKGDLSQNVQTWLEQGIGERRNEGFGRIAINWQPKTDDQGCFNPSVVKLSTTFDQKANQSTQPPATIPAPSDSHQLNLIKERIIRQRLDQRLVTLAQTYKIVSQERKVNDESIGHKNNKLSITSTQLARLWLTARNSIGKKGLAGLTELIESLPSNAQNQFERTIINQQPLLRWLKDLVNKTTPIEWDKHLNLPKPLEIPSELCDEYTLRLVMLVAKQARNMLNTNNQADGVA